MERWISLFFVLLLFVSSCVQKDTKNNLKGTIVDNPLTADGVENINLPKIQFEKTTHDFGTILQGEKISYDFKFKNVGKSDLVITSAKASCGCTVSEYPKYPIKPGASSSISVQFNSEGRKGQQVKTITVLTNAQPPEVVLTITAMVKEP